MYQFVKKLKEIFHVHRFVEVKKEVGLFQVVRFLKYHSQEYALKILEKCSCGQYRAYILDKEGTSYDRVPELLFPELLEEVNEQK